MIRGLEDAGRQAPFVGLDLCNSFLPGHDEGDRQQGAEHNQRYENDTGVAGRQPANEREPAAGRALSAARRRLPVGYTYEGMRTRLRVPVRTATARPPVSRTRPNAVAMPIPKSSHANDVDAGVEATGVDACSVLP